MRINPINNTNSINYRATIKPTKELEEGFNMVENSAKSGIMKNMNYAKDFLDSIAKINESKKLSDFKIEIDKRRTDHTYIKINGRRISGGHNEQNPNLQDNYLIVEGTKRYASKLEDIPASHLDEIKAEIEETQNKLNILWDRYETQLLAELQQAKKMIFKNN